MIFDIVVALAIFFWVLPPMIEAFFDGVKWMVENPRTSAIVLLGILFVIGASLG